MLIIGAMGMVLDFIYEVNRELCRSVSKRVAFEKLRE